MILVLCHGNYMRSPACEAVLKKHGLKTISAGFRPRANHAARLIREIMEARGYSLEDHVPKMVTQEMIDKAKLIVYMDGGQRRRLSEFLVDYAKTVCLASYLGKARILDPAFNRASVHSIIDDIIEASTRLALEYK